MNFGSTFSALNYERKLLLNHSTHWNGSSNLVKIQSSRDTFVLNNEHKVTSNENQILNHDGSALLVGEVNSHRPTCLDSVAWLPKEQLHLFSNPSILQILRGINLYREKGKKKTKYIKK